MYLYFSDVGIPQYFIYLGTNISQILFFVSQEEENRSLYADGWLHDVKYFDCASHRGTFVMLSQCKKDSRFQDSPHPCAGETKSHEGMYSLSIHSTFLRYLINGLCVLYSLVPFELHLNFGSKSRVFDF